MLVLPTGSGKTTIFSYVVKQSLERGKRVMVVSRGRKIVQQASDRLTLEEVPHGVMMGSHPLYAPERLVQICSISTLRTRKKWPQADLIVIDECHFATAPEFHEMLSIYPDAYVLSVTATPWTQKPLDHLASVIVSPVTPEEIIAEGFLVKGRYFAPTKPDLRGVRIRAGDYVEEDLERVMNGAQVVGDLVEAYQKFSSGLSALCFCVSIAHAKIVCEQFNQAGIPATMLHAGSPDDIRDRAIAELNTGPLQVICNVGVMGTGVDIPWLRTIISARPTKSLNLWLQQIGRGSRPYPGKDCFLVLDHADNCRKHGFMEEARVPTLGGVIQTEHSNLKTCEACYAIFDFTKNPETCPACLGVWRTPPKKNETVLGLGFIPKSGPGQLMEIGTKKKIPVIDTLVLESIQRTNYQLEQILTLKKKDGSPYSPWFAFHRVKIEMKGKIDEEALVRIFRAQAKLKGWTV